MELPQRFSGFESQGLIQDLSHDISQSGFTVSQFEIGDYKNFVYLICDWTTRRAAIVDPQSDLSEPLQALSQHGFTLERILLTHTHFDHIAGVPELIDRYSQIPVHVHSDDLRRFAGEIQSRGNFLPLQDGEMLKVGEVKVRVLHTPGHSAGECSFFIEDAPEKILLTGDTLFIRDCGRTDLESGSNIEMFKSLQKIKQLPPETVILPGHHYVREVASTLARELRDSAPLRCNTVEELAALP